MHLSELWFWHTCPLTNRGAILAAGMECRKNPKVEQKTRGTERRPPKKVQDLSSMSVDELWALHQQIAATLVAKITAEKDVIEHRLRLLNQVRSDGNGNNTAG
jgi:hypothetical protein